MKKLDVSPKVISLATGRRKNAVARVFLREGAGRVFINKKPMNEYFTFETQQIIVKMPLHVVELGSRFDITVNVQGGGINAQSQATQLGIARALVSYDSELRNALKPLKLLRRDSRIKERKKYGQKGARARFQYSKR